MKKTIASLCLVGLSLSKMMNLGIKSGLNANNLNVYTLSCDGGQGAVKYYVDGLPNGVMFDGSAITVTGNARAGTYTIRVKAVDSMGASVQRIITLSIQTQYQSNQNNAFSNGAGSFANGLAGQQAGNFANNGANGVNGANGANGVNGANGANGANNNGQIAFPGGAPVGGSPTGAGGFPSGGFPSGGFPSGGFPSGGSPNGGSPSSPGGSPSSPSPDPRLGNILSTYSPNAPTPLPNYGNRYPEPTLPTGADPNIPNTNLFPIANDQTRPTPANRNPITPDDIVLRAASDRHQNAIKGITNLLKIIDQARANKDKAQNDIQAYTQAYNDAVASQRNAQNDIIGYETKSSQIVSAINSLTSTIDDLKNKINDYSGQTSAFTKQKTGIVSTITVQQGQKAVLLDKLKALDDQVGQKVKQLSDRNAECQSLSDAVNRKTTELANAQDELASSQTTRNNIIIDINNKSGVVDDLRNRLQQAEKDLADAKIRLADLEARRLALPVQISTLRKQLQTLQAKARACADQVARIQAIIDNLKTGDYSGITKDINDINNKISISRTKVSEIDSQLASSTGPLEDLKAKLKQATEDLAFIRTQKNDGDAALRTAYQRGNDANNRVAFAKQNLDAVVKRFQDQSKIVSDATLNLERARAEQALARQGLEQLIAHYSDALPYAIVPNGNLSTNPGAPYGNNPSGSPLGPIRTDGNGAPGSFKVNNWTSYLSAAYGAGINPAIPGSVNELFPFNFLSGVSGNMGQGTDVLNAYGDISGLAGGMNGNLGVNGGVGGGCFANRANASQVAITGVVSQVRGDSFDVRANDGKMYTVRVAPCTQLAANKPGYRMAAGHKAIFKGYRAATNNPAVIAVDATQATCIE